MTSWREEDLPVDRIRRLSVQELHAEWATDPDAVQILDVRERREWDAGHIPGSLHVPYHDLRELPEALDAERPVAVICASGQRAAVGASLVRRLGARDAAHVADGGVPRWGREGWPVVGPEPARR